MSASNPIDNPAAWDRITFKGAGVTIRTPGIATVDVQLGRETDDQPVPGQDGVTVTHLRYTPAEVSIRLECWNRTQFQELEKIVRLFRPRRGEVSKAFEVAHPHLMLAGISNLYIVRMGVPRYSPRDGWSLEMTLREFWPERKGTTTKPTDVKVQTAQRNLQRQQAALNKPGGQGVSNYADANGGWTPPKTPTAPSAKGPPKP